MLYAFVITLNPLCVLKRARYFRVYNDHGVPGDFRIQQRARCLRVSRSRRIGRLLPRPKILTKESEIGVFVNETDIFLLMFIMLMFDDLYSYRLCTNSTQLPCILYLFIDTAYCLPTCVIRLPQPIGRSVYAMPGYRYLFTNAFHTCLVTYMPAKYLC